MQESVLISDSEFLTNFSVYAKQGLINHLTCHRNEPDLGMV